MLINISSTSSRLHEEDLTDAYREDIEYRINFLNGQRQKLKEGALKFYADMCRGVHLTNDEENILSSRVDAFIKQLDAALFQPVEKRLKEELEKAVYNPAMEQI